MEPMEPPRRSKRIKLKQEVGLPFNTENAHPLLNGLILENIFGYLKGQNRSTLLAPYRLVNKLWDQEIVKLLRKDTQVNLTKITTPYPNGLGWTSSSDIPDEPFYYEVPYPEIRTFENIIVTINSCEAIKTPNWVKWFEIMGSQVKRLQFSSPFTCFCQNHFLERILKEWCPNLEGLILCGVKCADSLLLMSSFLQTDKPLICNGLKSLKISFEEEEPYSLCLDKDSTHNSLRVLDINIRKLCMKLSIWKIVDFIYEHGLNLRNQMTFPEIVNTSGKKVTLPVVLRKFQVIPDLSTYFLPNLRPTDGGIVGQLMKTINLETLIIHGLNDLNQCQDLVTFFHIRPNNWRLTLKHLELDEYLSKSLKELHVIAQVRFPLTSLKLRGIHAERDNPKMHRLLKYFADTLEHLEITGPAVQQEVVEVDTAPSNLILPDLPKLKTFVHGDINACSFGAENLWRSAPNLERYSIKGSLTLGWDTTLFFGILCEVPCNVMRELRLSAPISGGQAEKLLDWYPNLVKVELVLESLGPCAFGFFKKLEKSKVEHLKITFRGYVNEKGEALDKSQRVIVWKTGNIKGLKSLKLDNMSELTFRLTPKPFSKAQLTSLKLINFGISGNEEKKMLSGLSHIPFIELVNTVE